MTRQREALGLCVFGLASAVAYVLQRLASHWLGEPGPELVLLSAHVPFFWRVALSLFQGLALGVIVAVLVPESHVERWLVAASRLALPITVALAAAAFAVP